MTIGKNKVVYMHYTLKNDNQEVLDSSEGQSPMPYIHGIGNIIPGLESQLEGKSIGDKIQASVKPQDGYGEYQDALVQIVPKSGFQGAGDELTTGLQVQVETNNGPAIAIVTNIEGDDVTLDLNHPLAGMTLHFDVEITNIREAEAEELSHGHVHGEGGHHH